ncbi:hypothetical protein [Pelagicoccus sp. SDUM812002]|uniref:hypothetical protein n=1 Tax=Pelagicoccus sp. SDUM812002 TaxID=3041266 RepID=UPI00280D2108|nr:hypothetical protein [Pelagicoccus sp. SDUM812002]MDQ8188044.1 hypothetical protein [Pelagicoccus sp. SDUM812002]
MVPKNMTDSPEPDSPQDPKPGTGSTSSPQAENPPPVPSFFAELKRRKVVRVAITYAIAAWLLMQVTAVVFPQFGLPLRAARFVTLLLASGFPIALIITWAFELTPTGVKLTKNVDAAGETASFQVRRNWMVIGFAAALPTVIFGALAVYFYFGRDTTPASLPELGSIAAITDERPYFIGTVSVLPPQMIAGPSENTAFADGLNKEVLTQLSAMRPLDVVSSASTPQPGDPDTSSGAVGRFLESDFVVETSLQVSGAHYRVTMQIVESATGRHLAVESLQLTMESEEEPFLFQKELAWEMALTLYRSLKRPRPPSAASRKRLEQVVGGLTAESKALQIRFWGDDGNTPDASLYDRIMELTGQVIAIDPGNADAHTDRGSLLGHAPFVGKANFLDENWRQELLLTLKRAVVINPDSVDSQRNLGRYYLITEGRPSRSQPYLQAAVRLADAAPPYTNNWPYYDLASALHQTGQSVAALSVLKRAPQEPEMDHINYWIDPFVAARRFSDALDFLQRHAPRLEANDDGSNALTIAHLRTDIEVRWTGDRAGFRTFLERIETDSNATAGMRSRYRLAAGDYAGVLRELAAVDPGRDPYAPNVIEMPLHQALALERTGNPALAHSYFRSVLKQYSSSPMAEMMLQRDPASVYATMAFMHAGLGEVSEMRVAIAQAREAADPGRSYQSYLLVEYLNALAFTQVGETVEACATIDQLLSAPAGESTGSILANVSFDSLHGSPEFQKVIRQHADQLKDPAVIEDLFALSSGEDVER